MNVMKLRELTTVPLVTLLLLCCSFFAQAQNGNQIVEGQVSDASHIPLSGASVTVKGTPQVTTTNAEGRFRLAGVLPTAVLVITYKGYKSLEVPVNNQRTLTITLEVDVNKLDDVVVVGYGTQRKAATTGAIASVKSADITQTPVVNVAQGLQARVSGVQITQNNAAPGGSISVRIRGTNSINGSSEPLYIVDGIQISNEASVTDASPLSTINPNDIESVEVLKDASATAIYGARGANGVVIISTRRGKNGPTRVQLETYQGIQQVTKTIDMLNAAGFAKLENEVYNAAIYINPDSLGKGIDWQDLLFRDAIIQNYQLSVSGGSEKTQFSISGNYFNQDGIIINSNFKRYSLRLNIDHKISDRFRMGATVLGSYSINNTIPTGATGLDGLATASIVGAALGAPPTLQPYREDGSIYPFSDQFNGRYREVVNPLGMAEVLNQKAIKRNMANLYAEAKITAGLTYRASFNADLSSTLADRYSPLYILGSLEKNSSSGSAYKGNSNGTALLHESILTWQRNLGEHSLKVTGVWGTQKNTGNSNSIEASGFPNDVTTNEAIGLAVNRTVGSYRTEERLDSYMGRLNYGFKNRYFIDVTMRYDGASKFGENNKYGFFPAVSAAWRIIDEPLLQRQDFFSDLKLRGSYGVTGNAAAIGPYNSLALVGSGSNYQFNHIYTIGVSPTGIPNKDLRWEKSTQLDVGVDLSILNNRLSFIADYYHKRTDDLLFVRNLPYSSGYQSVTGNFASIENKGLELSVSARILEKAVKWTVNGNITFNRNKLINLADNVKEYVVNNYVVLQTGQPLGIYKTYVFDGIYQTGETIMEGSGSRTGGVKVADVVKDGRITADDQVITGNANPSFIFGFSTNLSYRKFDFSAFVSGVQGNDLYNLSRYTFENPLGQRNVVAGMSNRWSPTNAANEYVSGYQGGRLPITNRFVEDGSFVRVKNITLGYTLPRIKGVSNIRVYLSGNNLFTFTRYSGYDPEVNAFGGSNTQVGIDNLVYPMSRSYLAGVQFTF
ncbi:TonB-linked SusC/RagA family outer membrane protein [Filimonas zeae]|uniref:SusC/RagA family TonB-linked outer membrane protein n=1 Tax=Filimonas zeae TaxID=1737353 RepID=A0A917J0N2_9BACT|nr:TonB-dependent receptor [Filimonas zeae]MDR6340326.1 TonB-linked SusC/RagA family outer membrane protein [Filimonas zeae]GGH72213.1 SusC/RagA family TonB-linked outer membrane protein [Filimonas zeae]